VSFDELPIEDRAAVFDREYKDKFDELKEIEEKREEAKIVAQKVKERMEEYSS
jgi:hypothetical protein